MRVAKVRILTADIGAQATNGLMRPPIWAMKTMATNPINGLRAIDKVTANATGNPKKNRNERASCLTVKIKPASVHTDSSPRA